MSKKNKLQKFADLLTFPNVIENFDPRNPELVGVDGLPVDLKGKWSQEFFKNNNPITIQPEIMTIGSSFFQIGSD